MILPLSSTGFTTVKKYLAAFIIDNYLCDLGALCGYIFDRITKLEEQETELSSIYTIVLLQLVRLVCKPFGKLLPDLIMGYSLTLIKLTETFANRGNKIDSLLNILPGCIFRQPLYRFYRYLFTGHIYNYTKIKQKNKK